MLIESVFKNEPIIRFLFIIHSISTINFNFVDFDFTSNSLFTQFIQYIKYKSILQNELIMNCYRTHCGRIQT